MVKVTYAVAIVCACLGLVHPKSYLNEFVAQVYGGFTEARNVARELGFQSVTKVEPFEDVYSFSHAAVPARSKRSGDHHVRKLSDHSSVRWVEQQHAKVRSKRASTSLLMTRELEDKAYDSTVKTYNDPLLADEWYLWDKVDEGALPKMDLHITPVWQAGITGKNISVSILDDGLEWQHADIIQNYDPFASCDLNDNDTDPTPRYDPTNENQHGTRCAGVVAMSANNAKCGVGIAPGAKIGGVRMLDGSVSDRVEAQALSFNYTHVDIYSASWGPSDSGRTVEGPGKLTAAAFELGITKGRNGKGSIYVWASGNGGLQGDSCECDGYASSPYTISISSASQYLMTPFYSELCPSTMATTFSSGDMREAKVVTTDLHNGCTSEFTGTSAAAPQAAGIFALTLERNPQLSWRDLQHVIAWTAEPYPLWANHGWKTNAAGFQLNTRFGFGILNAAAMVELADPSQWVTVPERKICEVSLRKKTVITLPIKLESGGSTCIVTLDSTGCAGSSNEVNFVEHVELVADITYSRRGVLSINMTSPQGTSTELLRPRYNDDSDSGFQNWPFMSVHSWAENPQGKWTVTIRDSSPRGTYMGTLNSVKLILYGTKEMPDVMRRAANSRRSYNAAYIDILRKRHMDKSTNDNSLPFLSSYN